METKATSEGRRPTAVKKKKKRVDWVGYVNYDLSRQELIDMDARRSEIRVDWATVNNWVIKGYKFSVSADSYHGGYVASLFDNDAESEHAGWVLTGWGHDVEDAIFTLACKHDWFLEGDWAAAKGRSERGKYR